MSAYTHCDDRVIQEARGAHEAQRVEAMQMPPRAAWLKFVELATEFDDWASPACRAYFEQLLKVRQRS